jgi:hypothetical protein
MCLDSRESLQGLAAARAGLKTMRRELALKVQPPREALVGEVTLAKVAAVDLSGVLHELPDYWAGLGGRSDRLGKGIQGGEGSEVWDVFLRMSNWKLCRIANTEGHHFRLDRLMPEELRDTPGQDFRFVVDWDLAAVEGPGERSLDPTRLVGRLDEEQHKLYEAEFELYRERGWWGPEGSEGKEPDGEGTVIPVLSEGMTTKASPVIDLRTINEGGPEASNSRCRVNGAVRRLRDRLGHGEEVQQNDLSKTFYRIGTTKLWAITTGVESTGSEGPLFGLNVGPPALEAVAAELKGLLEGEVKRLRTELVELMDDYLLVVRREDSTEFSCLFGQLLGACGFEVPEPKREWWSRSQETQLLEAHWTWDGKDSKCRWEVPEPWEVSEHYLRVSRIRRNVRRNFRRIVRRETSDETSAGVPLYGNG